MIDFFVEVMQTSNRLRRLVFAFVALTLFGTLIMALPSVIISLREFPSRLMSEYRRAFAAPKLVENVQSTVTASTSAEITAQLKNLENQLDGLRSSSTPDERVEKLESAVRDLRKLLLGSPEQVLTIQRLNLELSSLSSRVDLLQGQMQWLFGISLTIALGVLAASASVVVKSIGDRREAPRSQ